MSNHEPFEFVIIYVGQRVFGGKFDEENHILYEAVEYYNILSPQGLTILPIKMGDMEFLENMEMIIVRNIYVDCLHRDSYMKVIENINIIKPSTILRGKA